MKSTFILFVITLMGLTAKAQTPFFWVDGELRSSSNAPVTANPVNFTVTIKKGSCVVFAETHAIDMTTSEGMFALKVGTGTGVYVAPGFTNALDVNKDVNCQGGGTSGPGTRSIQVSATFNSETVNLAAVDIGASPGALTVPAALAANTLSVNSTSATQMAVYNASKTNFFNIAAPTTFSNYTLTFPTSAGTSNQVLATDGSGNLFWSAPGGSANATQIQGANISATAPTNGQLLTYNGTNWAPASSLTLSNNTPASDFIQIASTDTTGKTFVSVKQDGAGPAGFRAQNYGGSTSTSGQMVFQKASGTSGAPTAVGASEPLGVIYADGYNGSAFGRGAGIKFVSEEAFTGAAYGTSIQFFTANLGSTTLNEKLRIASSGVGIGVASPAAALDVNGGVRIGADVAGCAAPKLGTIRLNASALEFCNGSSWTPIGGGGGLSTTLASGNIYVGNGSNVASAVAMSGDATLSNTGVLSLNTVPVNKGGTGATTLNANQILGTNGTGNLVQSVTCGVNQVISFDASGYYQCNPVGNLGAFVSGGNTAPAADMSLGTTNNYGLRLRTNNTDRVYVNNNGEVGIGAPSPGPEAMLFVQGSASAPRGISVRNTSTLGETGLAMHNDRAGAPIASVAAYGSAHTDAARQDRLVLESDGTNGKGIGLYANGPAATIDFWILGPGYPDIQFDAQGYIRVGDPAGAPAAGIAITTPPTEPAGYFLQQNPSSNQILPALHIGAVQDTPTTRDAQFGTSMVIDLENYTDGDLTPAGEIGAFWEQTQTSSPSTRNSSLFFGTTYQNSFKPKMVLSSAGDLTLEKVTPASYPGTALRLQRAKGSWGSKTAVQGGDEIGSVEAYGFGSTTYSQPGAAIRMIATQPHTDTTHGTQLAFETTMNGGSSPNGRMVITSDGTVGINNMAPNSNSKLQVDGAIVSTPNFIASGTSVNLSLSNTHVLQAPGGSAITLTNFVNGGSYTLVVSETTSRTYTFSGCTNSYYSPANATTTNRSIYKITFVAGDCYIDWKTGYN